jgi:hypothetical protein
MDCAAIQLFQARERAQFLREQVRRKCDEIRVQIEMARMQREVSRALLAECARREAR